MEAMGFARAEIDRAMRAAYFNPDRAVDYLLNGIPESVLTEQLQAAAVRSGAGGEGQAAGTGTGTQTTSPPPATGATGTTTNTEEPVNLFEAAAQAGGRGGTAGGQGAGAGTRGGAGAGGAPANLDFLRNSPQFQQLRQLVQQQPAMLDHVLQQVAEGNPQLAQMIGQNQDQFLQLLSEVSFLSLLSPYLLSSQSLAILIPQLLTLHSRTSAQKVSAAWVRPAPCHPVQSPSPSPRKNATPSNVCAGSASPVIKSSRPISPAIRMRSWRRIFCLSSLMMKRVPRCRLVGGGGRG